MANMAYDFPVFCCFDHEEAFDGQIRVGEYYISRDWKLGIQEHQSDRCPHNAVRYSLENNYIDKSDIKYQLVSTNKIVAKDVVKNFVDLCFDTFGNVAKSLINCFIGMLGQLWINREYGASTGPHLRLQKESPAGARAKCQPADAEGATERADTADLLPRAPPRGTSALAGNRARSPLLEAVGH